ncbi:MAG: hypothetical protein K0S41_3299 [Anaerocolumna sp.]|jgi:hypothetical protein|nr:hypothetical protein [Anaerocolumna sp.]
MEAIKVYVENMFTNFPVTSKIIELKDNILSNMEDKYNELKSEGKSETEAVGIVISEFGNIDELMKEYGISSDVSPINIPKVTQIETDLYLSAKKTSGLLIGIGVFLCICAAASSIFFSRITSDGLLGNLTPDLEDLFTIVPLLILVAMAVGIFLISGTQLKNYRYLEDIDDLPVNIKSYIKQKSDHFNQTYTLSLIIGVCMCILSPIGLFITSAISDEAEDYGAVALLILVGIATFIFIYYGTIKGAYKKLLHEEE